MVVPALGSSLPTWTEVWILSQVFYFYWVSFGSWFDPNQILPLTILLLKCEITWVILHGIYSKTFYWYVLKYTFQVLYYKLTIMLSRSKNRTLLGAYALILPLPSSDTHLDAITSSNISCSRITIFIYHSNNIFWVLTRH